MNQHIPYSFLVAIDGSTIADLATTYIINYGSIVGFENIDVHIVNVQSVGHRTDDHKSITDVTELAKTATAKTRKIFDDAKINYRVHIETGEVADTIWQIALNEKVDELVLGSRGLGAVKNIVLGSVAYKVIHLATKPVTIINSETAIRKSGRKKTHKILLAVDGSENSVRATQYVSQLHYTNAPIEIQLVNVQLPIVSGNVRRFISQETIDLYYREEGASALRHAEEALRATEITFVSHTLVGHIAETIVEFAETQTCERIIMGTRGIGMMKNLLLGSIAYKVIHAAHVPVTVVK